jgi:hypothetical protein
MDQQCVLVETAEGERLKVRIVDGTEVRNKLFTDFTAGGHGFVYCFVPRDEIWIEQALPQADLVHVLRHELRERQLMKDEEMRYEAAHDKVTAMEAKERGGHTENKDSEVYTKEAAVALVRWFEGKLSKVANDAKREYSCLMLTLPPELAAKVKTLADAIEDADLYHGEDGEEGKYGRERDPHITVKYGIHTDDPVELTEILDQFSKRDACSICGATVIMSCRCPSKVVHDKEALEHGHGRLCLNGHRVGHSGVYVMDTAAVERFVKCREEDGDPAPDPDPVPIRIKLGATTLFENDDKPYDVVKIDVESADLAHLNSWVANKLECTDKYPEYHPHITLAYVKKGLGKKYTGDRRSAERNVLDLEGVATKSADLDFSDGDGNHTMLTLSHSFSTNNQPETVMSKSSLSEFLRKSAQEQAPEQGQAPAPAAPVDPAQAEEALQVAELKKQEAVASAQARQAKKALSEHEAAKKDVEDQNKLQEAEQEEQAAAQALEQAAKQQQALQMAQVGIPVLGQQPQMGQPVQKTAGAFRQLVLDSLRAPR